MMKNIFKIFSLLFILVLLISGCNGQFQSQENQGNTEHDGKLNIYTSFYTMYDFTSKIGGDKVNVVNLVPTGTEPHDWEPSPSDITKLETGDMLVYNGAGMESWVDDVVKSLSNQDLVLVEASKGLTLLEGHHEEEEHEDGDEEEHDHGKFDPHVWMDPLNAKKEMETIKNALINIDPKNENYYEENYNTYSKQMDELNKEFKETVAGFSKKDIVVAHEAYGYLCNAYGLNQIPIEGLGAESEPSSSRMVEIVEFAKENSVNVIFFEDLVSPKVAETIAEEVGASTEVLSPLEGLSQENIDDGKEYISVMKDNLNALKKALE